MYSLRSLQILAALYCALSILCFVNVILWSRSTSVSGRRLGALGTATFLPPVLLVALYAFGTCAVFRGAVWNGGISFSYGAVTTSAFWVAAVLLQAAVTIQSYGDQMDTWGTLSSTTPSICICAATLGNLICMRDGLRKHLSS